MKRLKRALVCTAACIGAACGERPPVWSVSGSDANAFEVALAAANDRFAVAWHDDRDGHSNIVLRYVDAAGVTVGPEYSLTNHRQDAGISAFEPSIAAFATDAPAGQPTEQPPATRRAELAIAWYERSAGIGYRAYLMTWSERDGELWRVPLGEAGVDSRNPVVRVYGDRIFASWIEREAGRAGVVVASWWSAAGERLSAPVVLGTASAATWNLNAAIDSAGEAYVVWDAIDSTEVDELYLARYDPIVPDLRRLTADDGNVSKFPDIQVAGDRIAVAWHDERDGNAEVYVMIAGLDTTGEIDGSAVRLSESPGESIGAYLAWNGERLGVAWSDTVGDTIDVCFVVLSGRAPESTQCANLSRSRERSLIPAIVPWQSGFAVAWNDATGLAGIGHAGGIRSRAMMVALP